MFSHLIGNLIMGELDADSAELSAKYFRYVDDITLVGSRAEVEQSFAVFLLNDVYVQRNLEQDNTSELMRFAKSGTDFGMMKSSDPFIREIACLHGLSEKPRHSGLLETVFDVDEDLALDAITSASVRRNSLQAF